MYDGKRSPDLLFAALSRLREFGNPAASVRVVFYGQESGGVMESARRFGVAELVEHRGVVAHEVALAEQRASAALLVFLNMDPATAGELGSKALEYASSRRPILAFGPSASVMRSWLSTHRLGWFASSVEEAVVALKAAHAGYVAGKYELGPPSALFTACDVAAAFAGELDRVTASRSSATVIAQAAPPSP